MTSSSSRSTTATSTIAEAAPLSPCPPDDSGGVEAVMPSSPTSILSLDVYLLLDNEDIQHIKNDTDSESVVPCYYYMSDDEDNDDIEDVDSDEDGEEDFSCYNEYKNKDVEKEEHYIAHWNRLRHRNRDSLQPSPMRHYHYKDYYNQQDQDDAASAPAPTLASNHSLSLSLSLRSVSSFGSQDFPPIHLEYSLDEDEEENEEELGLENNGQESEDELEIYDSETERTNSHSNSHSSKGEALVDGLVGLGCLPEVASDIFSATSCKSIQCLS